MDLALDPKGRVKDVHMDAERPGRGVVGNEGTEMDPVKRVLHNVAMTMFLVLLVGSSASILFWGYQDSMTLVPTILISLGALVGGASYRWDTFSSTGQLILSILSLILSLTAVGVIVFLHYNR